MGDKRKTCATCRWWDGRCHRYAPRQIMGRDKRADWDWPMTNGRAWCGEHEEVQRD